MCHYYTKQKKSQHENILLPIQPSLQSVEGTTLLVADVLSLSCNTVRTDFVGFREYGCNSKFSTTIPVSVSEK